MEYSSNDSFTVIQSSNAFKRIISSPKLVRIIRVSVLNFLYGAYFAWATYHFFDLKTTHHDKQSTAKSDTYCQGYCGIQWCDGYGMLLLLTVFTYVGLFYYKLIKPKFGASIHGAITKPLTHKLTILFRNVVAATFITCAIFIALTTFVYNDTVGSPERRQSLLGIVGLLVFGYIFSSNRRKIKWRPVICGFLLQVLLGIFCIRIEIGRRIFGCIGKKVATFLKYADEGSSFLYGDFLVKENRIFAFAALPVIFFVSFIISALYYWNVMQWIVQRLGGILQSIVGTTICESVVAAGNIFLGMTETPLLIRPYIEYLTASELHAVMTSGFATVSGTVLAAYISFGAEASHLIISTVMAAPASLAFSKLFLPEEEDSQTTSDNIAVPKSKDISVFDAACNGARSAISMVLSIAANLVAFVSFIAFMNGVLGWFGYLIGQDYLSFEWIFAKLFWPLAYVLGIPSEDCENVAKVIATKTIINEFVAYQRLGEMKDAKLISLRSSAIATFAVCGFANPGSLGIMIGGLSSICPERRSDILKVSMRALISGSVTCFINASIAGLLMDIQ